MSGKRISKEKMRFLFPLKVITPQYDCPKDEQEGLSSVEAASYKDQILSAIAKENRDFENERGLAEYLDMGTLKDKMQSLHTSLEVWNSELFGVMTAHVNVALTPEETSELVSWIEGRNFDGWGIGMELSSNIRPAGKILVGICNEYVAYCIQLDQELKQQEPDLGQDGPVMGGLS